MNIWKSLGTNGLLKEAAFGLCFLEALMETWNIYLLTVNDRNTRTKCALCLKLIIKTLEGRHWRRSGVFIVNSEHISHLVSVFLLLTLNM